MPYMRLSAQVFSKKKDALWWYITIAELSNFSDYLLALQFPGGWSFLLRGVMWRGFEIFYPPPPRCMCSAKFADRRRGDLSFEQTAITTRGHGGEHSGRALELFSLSVQRRSCWWDARAMNEKEREGADSTLKELITDRALQLKLGKRWIFIGADPERSAKSLVAAATWVCVYARAG